jgi:hypothetical protein
VKSGRAPPLGRTTGASADQIDHFGANCGSVGWTSVSLTTTALPASP